MILESMLGRLNAHLTAGPSLNARPHNSRQRLDVMDLQQLGSLDPAQLISTLLDGKASLEVAAKIPVFVKPELPEEQWTEGQRADKNRYDRQAKVLNKLRDIAEDANDYYNDQGEHALYIGFPLVSIPSRSDRGAATKRVLAPAILLPINMRVRRGVGAGITIELAGDGADLVQSNPGLLAWLEQQTGASTEGLFTDENGEEPWKEITEVLGFIEKAAGVSNAGSFTAHSVVERIPKTESLPNEPAIVPGAVLGLFPLTDPGLLRDTKWMIQKEPELDGPVKTFLNAEALAEPEEAHLPEAVVHDHTSGNNGRPAKTYAQELLVTHADPCQTEAVQHARTSKALVVHGPPGTGKSQTIANIIGDHLARGQRVLFVCDKRTALDVVKYRLDSMGIGHLCGVVHDPQRDRKALYLGLRNRLEQLAEEPVMMDPASNLALINDRLDLLHGELRGYYDLLHAESVGAPSFHRLCGQWLELQSQVVSPLPSIEGLTVEMIERHRTDIEEVAKRAIKARWPESPFQDALSLTLMEYQAMEDGNLAAALDHVVQQVESFEAGRGTDDLPLLQQEPLDQLATARTELALAMDEAESRAPLELFSALLDSGVRARVVMEVEKYQKDLDLLERPLDREIGLHVGATRPSLAQCNQYLLRIQAWETVSLNWHRWFAGKVKREAKDAVGALGLGWDAEGVRRAKEFLSSVRVRHIWSDLYHRASGHSTTETYSDQTLLRFAKGTHLLCNLINKLGDPAHAAIRKIGLASIKEVSTMGLFTAQLRASVDRCAILLQCQTSLDQLQLFTPNFIASQITLLRGGSSTTEWLKQCREFLPVLEDTLRLLDRISTLPAPLRTAMSSAVARGLSFEMTEPALRCTALQMAITDRMISDPELSRIDSERIESGFSEMLGRNLEKTEQVRDKIKHAWQIRAREKLLATTGSRLNNQGAALRQRLYVRGQKAMKLRQMIASGANTPGGDPLFDLCPVWMASPSTVSQIFPKEALFDVIVFDEASQCRLEEALPVLLRGKRVVIAGDPKQLPPTKFFESALTESDDGDAESAEELFISRQSQAEDLLSSALNLNVQEAFLDVHYRSRNEALIGFSNDAFYEGRLQPIPGHPGNKLMKTPIELIRVDGTYIDRSNPEEATAVVELVATLLALPEPPSIGVACFNITQRDAILDAMDKRAAESTEFAMRLENARHRKGRDSFEGLFVKNLENVQGDERDHMIICTTFGLDKDGKFRRNFGALSRAGGERRLNVLVTRARDKVHVLTSIPRAEYISPAPMTEGQSWTGRHHLYAYLRYAELLAERFKEWQGRVNALYDGSMPGSEVQQTATPSSVAESVGQWLCNKHGIGNRVYWGNEGFCVDIALTHPGHPADVTIGVLTDFTRYRKTPDPILWELFRSTVLLSQGWELLRIWSPSVFKNNGKYLEAIRSRHQAVSFATQLN